MGMLGPVQKGLKLPASAKTSHRLRVEGESLSCLEVVGDGPRQTPSSIGCSGEHSLSPTPKIRCNIALNR